MKYRQVGYLIKSEEFKVLVRKYKLKSKIIHDQRIVLISECYVFDIYGFIIEDFFYFDFYTIDLNLYSNVGRILSAQNNLQLNSIYRFTVDAHEKVLIHRLQGDKGKTLSAEQHFFAYLRLLDVFMSDYLRCNTNSIDLRYFNESSCAKKEELLKIINENI